MTIYIVAQLRFTDISRYRAYQARFAEVFRGSGGRLLAADERPELLEGDAGADKVVIMAFDDEPTARAFIDNPAYQAISEDRHAGAESVSLLVRGWPPA